MSITVEAKKICKIIGEKSILDNVDLSVREGEIYGFLDANGAGKTTFIKILMGMYVCIIRHRGILRFLISKSIAIYVKSIVK